MVAEAGRGGGVAAAVHHLRQGRAGIGRRMALADKRARPVLHGCGRDAVVAQGIPRKHCKEGLAFFAGIISNNIAQGVGNSGMPGRGEKRKFSGFPPCAVGQNRV